jgi:apolipoprotein N-acyltransferase
MAFRLSFPGNSWRALPAGALIEFLILCVLAFTAGVAASFAMAPYQWWGLLVPASSGLYLLLSRTSRFAGGMALGWSYGFGFFLFSLSWIGNALLVEGNPYAWAWGLAVCALPAALAFFPALACGIASRFVPLRSVAGFAAFCALLSLSEWMRGHLFTGFPWNLTAYAWGGELPLLQVLHLADIYTLSLFITALCTVPALCILIPRRSGPWALALLLLLSTAGLYLYGSARLKDAPLQTREDVAVKIVQPNIAQEAKWDGSKIAGHFERMIELSYAAGDESPDRATIIVWPETALHYLFLNDKGSRGAIAAMLQSYPGPAFLITGALIHGQPGSPFANSVIAIDKSGEPVTRYDKFHLVPFGEYIPFQRWIPLETVTQFSGFERGPGPQTDTIDLGGGKTLPFSPLVCYEILFPGQVVNPADPPAVIINVTNDGWYGFSAGPHQHLMKARFRAIEEGLPVIRSANTGISAVIDPYGRFLMHSELFSEGVYNAPLPLPAGQNILFHIKKEWFYWVFVVFLFIPMVKIRKSANSEL